LSRKRAKRRGGIADKRAQHRCLYKRDDIEGGGGSLPGIRQKEVAPLAVVTMEAKH